jgi:hypothetical protein
MFGREEQDIQMPVQIPVHLTYQTAFVDDAGKLNFRQDVYGLDSRMVSAIRSERNVVEVAERRHEEPVSSTSGSRRQARQQIAPQRTLSFFEQLFGGGAGRPPAPVTRYR